MNTPILNSKVTVLKAFKISFSLAAVGLLLGACQTIKQESTSKAEETPTFSISAGQSDPRRCNVTGEMSKCNVYWNVESGILTHRQDCVDEKVKYTPLVLNAMAKSLKESCPLKIRYVRMTSKDDVQSEQRLARMVSQSKTWRSYSKAPQAQRKKLSDAFVKKVVDHKNLFSDVTLALNSVGYQFKLVKVEVADLSPLTQSRHFHSLRTIGASQAFLVPQNLRLVWRDVQYRPRPVRRKPVAPTPRSSQIPKAEKIESIMQNEIPTVLPDKEIL